VADLGAIGGLGDFEGPAAAPSTVASRVLTMPGVLGDLMGLGPRPTQAAIASARGAVGGQQDWLLGQAMFATSIWQTVVLVTGQGTDLTIRSAAAFVADASPLASVPLLLSDILPMTSTVSVERGRSVFIPG
jgi:hypothetical protein